MCLFDANIAVCFLLQKDFNVRELREFNKAVMSQLGDAVQVHPDLGEAVNMYFSQVNQASR